MLTLCCNMCGWFSVIGSGLYIVLGIMITNRNKAVVEHKFKLPSFTNEGSPFASYDKVIAETQTNMFVMAIVLATLALACLITGLCLGKKEIENEERARKIAAKKYSMMFREEEQVISYSGLEVELAI